MALPSKGEKSQKGISSLCAEELGDSDEEQTCVQNVMDCDNIEETEAALNKRTVAKAIETSIKCSAVAMDCSLTDSLQQSSTSFQESAADISSDVTSGVGNSESVSCVDIDKPSFPKRRRRWKREIYDKNGDPESIKLQRKKRAVELKLKNLKWTLNQPAEVSGKRKKKAPERFELALLSKRRTAMDNVEGDGDLLGDIPWIVQQVRVANIYILRLLHRVIFRRQGMFSEKHIRKSVLSFRGFPFDFYSTEVKKRKYPLEKASPTSLAKLCDLLGVRNGSKEEMIENILMFLTHPSKQEVEDYVKEVMAAKCQQQKLSNNSACTSPANKIVQVPPITIPCPVPHPMNLSLDCSQSSNSSMTFLTEEECIITGPWEKPQFFVEGTGIKLKYIKPIVTSLQVVTDSLIELLHRILFLNGDEKANMRRNILEFSGFCCIVGSNDYVLRTRLLAVLPLDQLKFICRVLGLPTWHRSRQLLIETIMDFLAAPRLSAMKKREVPLSSFPVTPPLPNNVCPLAHGSLSSLSPEAKLMETEEIEIVPDIHISDEEFDISQRDCALENIDDKDVKLKHFQNIHFQVISTPAGKLNDLHMILYLKPCPLTTVRKNILEFSRFLFDDQSAEYQCRQALMEHMFLENLKRIASVLCLSQYIVDQSRANIIQAVLRFLLKPSVLFNACSMLPSSPETADEKKAAEIKDDVEVMKDLDRNVENCDEAIEKCPPACSDLKADNAASLPEPVKLESGVCHDISQPNVNNDAKGNEAMKTMKAELESSIRRTSTPRRSAKKRRAASEPLEGKPCVHGTVLDTPRILQNGDLDEPLALVKKKSISVSSYETRLESDEDDQPLAKFIGHPNDDQIKNLISKVMKESKLEEITMKQLIKTVFNTYPHFDLSYRKEFIKSVVRQILSQMDQPSCSVSTTVLTF